MMSIETFHDSCRQLEAATDTRLTTYFVRTSAIDEIARFDSRRALTVGLKGIGKTAAYRYFTEFERTPDVTVGITPEKFSLHLTNKNLHYSTCRKQFEHDLVLEALRAITEKRKALAKRVDGKLLDEAAAQVKAYTETLKKLAARITGGGISILGCGFTLTKGDVPVAVGLTEEHSIVAASSALKKICAAGLKIRIVVDDPEQVFSASRELDTHLVGGFCLAALRLQDAIPGLKVIALLKTHVYYPTLMAVDDLRKYPDHMGRLSWNKDELARVVADRLHSAKVTWADIFLGNETEARRLLSSMGDEIRNGPRDLLRWLDLGLQARKNGKIDERMVKSTKKAMSLDSLGEWESAHGDAYQKISAVIRAIFGKKPKQRFSLPELKAHIQGLMLNDDEMKTLTNLPWMQLETSATLPDLLFKAGALVFESNQHDVLPYQEDYDERQFARADHIGLVPLLIEAIS
jgi:hypothetical protein